MLHIKDVEEKKMIVAYYMVRNRKNLGLENVWRVWSAWWEKDFSDKGRPLTMYDHKLVLSKTKAREKVRAGENYQDYKEYDDFLAEICEWLKGQFDTTDGRKTHASLLKEQLLKHRSICDQNIRKRLKNSGLRAEGYKLQNQTSKKHPLLLGRYLIIGTEGCIKQGSYEEIMNYIDEMEECK